ncbi:MAG: protein-(glutamine-N5) methyltransferase, release factor-specific, partial [Chloroflexota bacterium]
LDTLAVAKHEPRLALDGGPDGLSLIRRLLTDAPKVLEPGGTVLLEIEYRQGEAVAALAREAFPDARVEVHKDLAGLDRVVEIGVNG